MKSLLRFLTSIALFSFCSLQADTPAVQAPAAAKPATPVAGNFTLLDAHGKSVSLSDFAGKWVVLEWVNFKCPFVQKFYSVGAMQRWQEDYGKKGVVWLSVCSSAKGKPGHFSGEELKKMLQDHKLKSTHYLLDEAGTLGKAFDAKTTPTMVVIGPAREVIYNGALDSITSPKSEDIAKAENFLAPILDAALAGKAPAYRQTKAYGCSVKY